MRAFASRPRCTALVSVQWVTGGVAVQSLASHSICAFVILFIVVNEIIFKSVPVQWATRGVAVQSPAFHVNILCISNIL